MKQPRKAWREWGLSKLKHLQIPPEVPLLIFELLEWWWWQQRQGNDDHDNDDDDGDNDSDNGNDGDDGRATDP